MWIRTRGVHLGDRLTAGLGAHWAAWWAGSTCGLFLGLIYRTRTGMQTGPWGQGSGVGVAGGE